MTKKWLAALLACALVLSLFSLAGCKGGESAVAQNYRRMKRMNLKWGDEYVTLDCDWGDDGCNLTIVEEGNLIKIYFPGDDSAVYTFEYYDDTVKQPWERTLPYLFLDDGVGFNLVTFWGLFE